MSPRAIGLSTHSSDRGWWEMARGPAHSALAGDVAGYCGYEESGGQVVRRRQVADGRVVLVISFGDQIDIASMTNSPHREPLSVRSFIAGMHEGYAVTQHGGRQHGVEVLLGPLAATRLLGVPMDEVANQVVPLEAVRGRETDELVDRLAALPTWDARFGLLDATLLRWREDSADPDRAVAWAWRQLQRARGNVAVGALAAEIGWSRRHFASRFRHYIGLTPKSTARVLRFAHAVDLLGGAHPTIADVAANAGYADHSHLVREFRALAGCTPTQLMAARMPAAGGVSA